MSGPGALTRYLHPVARRVLAIEIDFSFMPRLEDRFGESTTCAVPGDVESRVDKLVASFCRTANASICSNLPYYITTPVIFHFLESPPPMRQMVVMVQEVWWLTVTVDTHDYGVLAAARYFGDVDRCRVPRTCFRPIPKVDSCVSACVHAKRPVSDGPLLPHGPCPPSDSAEDVA